MIREVCPIVKKGVYIPSIDGKDLYISNNYLDENLNGYSIKKKDGSYNLKKFINSLDYSLDLIELRKIFYNAYRRKGFSFWENGKEYSNEIINVTFKYCNKEYNKVRTNTYVKFGHKVDDKDFSDCVFVKDGELIGIKTGEKVSNLISEKILGKYFYVHNGKYEAKENIKTLTSISKIREEIYENGFICDGKKYVRFKRSSGSSRVGKCLFIDEKLYSRIHKWEMCGIKIKKGGFVDLASLEPYIALTLSSIIDTIQIKPENFLVIDDYTSIFKDNAVATRLIDGKLSSNPEIVEVSNSIWDGESLMDKSLFGNYQEKGMLLLRGRFFKSCCFNTNIQKFFKDNNIVNIEQLNGFTLAKDISDVKIITTPSSIKYLKFGTLKDWLNYIGTTFGIVIYKKKTHFFDGRMVQVHYQLLNTLQLSYEEVREFVKPSLEYVQMIKTDPAVLRHQISFSYHSPDDIYYTDFITSKNDIIYQMLGINDDFAKTKLYRLFRNDLIKSYIKNLRCGHILVNGNYSTLCGNPIEMLKFAINKFDGKTMFKKGTVHSTRFEDGTDILGSRSPQVAIGNNFVAKNYLYKDIDKYMNSTQEIIYVNSIEENLLERLSGCDFDSDSMLITDNEILVNAVKRNYHNFPVPTKKIDSKKIDSKKMKRKYTPSQQADLDTKTSVNKIGEIVNLSQCLNSILWDELNNGKKIEDIMELYCDIAQLDVMSNLEIDAAKRENPANNAFELKLLKEKYTVRDEKGRQIRPLFFKYIDSYKGYCDDYYVYKRTEENNFEKVFVANRRKDAYDFKRKYKDDDIFISKGRMAYSQHKTTMDYLQLCIDECKLRKKYREENLPLSDILIDIKDIRGRIRYDQVKLVIERMREVKSSISHIWNTDDFSNQQKREMVNEFILKMRSWINGMNFNMKTVRYLISLVDNPKYSDISKLLFDTILDVNNKEYYEVIIRSKKPIEKLEESDQGDIDIMGIRYKKTYFS